MAAAGNGRQGASTPAMCEAPTQGPPEPAAWGSQTGGYPCPGCGSRTIVTNSRPGPEGVRRRRECTQCQQRFSTVEVHEADWDGETNFKRYILPRLLELRRWLDLLHDVKDP